MEYEYETPFTIYNRTLGKHTFFVTYDSFDICLDAEGISGRQVLFSPKKSKPTWASETELLPAVEMTHI